MPLFSKRKTCHVFVFGPVLCLFNLFGGSCLALLSPPREKGAVCFAFRSYGTISVLLITHSTHAIMKGQLKKKKMFSSFIIGAAPKRKNLIPLGYLLFYFTIS